MLKGEILVKKWYVNYDGLRALSCFTVVLLHVSSRFLSGGGDFDASSLLRTLSRMAVPTFVMLSGAFVISDKNIASRDFYKHAIEKIGVPIFLYSAFYVIFAYVNLFRHGNLATEFWEPLRAWLIGQPVVYMWFMYMLIGLYVITPLLSYLTCDMRKGDLYKYFIFTFVVFIYSFMVEMSCELSWILQWASWLGYFLVGNFIRLLVDKLKSSSYLNVNNRNGFFLILASYTMLIVFWYCTCHVRGEMVEIAEIPLLLVLATLLQYLGFSLMEFRSEGNFIKLISRYSLHIYLLHPLFLTLTRFIPYEKFSSSFYSFCAIIIISLAICIMCVVIVKAFQGLCGKVSAVFIH